MKKAIYTICFLSIFATGLSAQWSVENLSSVRYNIGLGTANGKVFFAGSSPSTEGMVVDIYDIASSSWTTQQLSVFRQFTFATGIGDKMYFAGYTQTQEPDQEVIEIYDTTSDEWSAIDMPDMDGATSMTSVGDLLVLCHGGSVKMYNTTTGTWTSGSLSVSRILALVVGCNGKVVFAGGGFLAGTLYDLVDIYDVNSNSWTTATMSDARNQIEGVCLNNKIYLVGGATGFSTYSTSIDIFDTNSSTWSLMEMNAVKSSVGLGATDTNLYITGGRDETTFDRLSEVEVINGVTGVKTMDNLSTGRSATSTIGVGNMLFVAGGFEETTTEWVSTVDVFQEGPVSDVIDFTSSKIQVYPNPSHDNITITDNDDFNLIGLDYEIYDISGALKSQGKIQNEISISNLSPGMYFLKIGDTTDGWKKFVKN